MGDLINIPLNALISIVVYFTTLFISMGGSIIRAISNPFTGIPVFNITAGILETSSEILIDSLSGILINGRNIINSFFETIFGGILDIFKIGSSVVPVFGVGGVTLTIILEYIIKYSLAIITAIAVITLISYALYYILYVIFHLFAGIFIAKLLVLIFVSLFIWLFKPIVVAFIKHAPEIIEPVRQYIVKFLGIPFRIFRRFGGSNDQQFGGGNESNYNKHIQFLTLFFSVFLIMGLLTKVYEKVYELYNDEEDEDEEDEEDEDEEDNDDA